MATLLPTIPHNSFSGSFVSKPYLCSTSPSSASLARNGSTNSISTINHLKQRSRSSSSSYISVVSTRGGPLRVRNENEPPPRSVSLSTLDVVERSSNVARLRNSSLPTRDDGPLDDIDLDAACGSTQWEGGSEISKDIGNRTNLELSFDITREEGLPRIDAREKVTISTQEPRASVVAIDSTLMPFRRWMSTLRRKNQSRRKSLTLRTERWSLDDNDGEELHHYSHQKQEKGHSRHQKTSSHSSSGFITAVKSASVSLASLSVAPRSRHAARSSRFKSEHRNSGLSQNDCRPSIENTRKLSGPFMDEAAWDRALKRRKILEELVSSEESYVADLKVLTNVYFTLLASVPSLSQHTQSSIQRNIAEILRLHEDLLRQLHHVLRDSEVNQIHLRQGPSAKSGGRVRWHSLDISGKMMDSNDASGRRKSFDISETWNNKKTALVAEPKQAADIARVFQNVMNRFFAYEEYGAKYEMMVQDMASTYSSIPNWHAYERGIEALANSLTSINGREANSRKGLTFGDLLIKPIQRVCKYPLLFSDLHKHTPVIDCPESHSQIEKVLCRLRETTKEINKATDDPKTRDRIQKTWLLQDRFILQDESLPALALRQLGHVLLCGVLHVAYQTKMGVEGGYMVCVLFKSCLLLATLSAGAATYEITVGIGLSDLRIEETDNGKDLQCYTAHHSWKVIFESDHRLFELIFSACSAKEEEGWRTCLLERSAAEHRDLDDGHTAPPEMCSTLTLDLKSIGNIFGQPGTLARRISVQRAATVGPKTNVCQVIIKNTHALRDNGISPLPASPSMNRSQSLLTTNRIPVLAPKRAERVRLEHALNDIWTRDFLPYPGMGAVRGDHLIRASASSVMRKLSMASIASSFTKRSNSYASLVPGKANDSGKELEDVIEKPNHDGSDSEPFEDIPKGQKTATPVRLRPIMPPPRTSSASGTKRLKGNRLIKNPKPPDPSFPGTNEGLARTETPGDSKPTSKTRTKWNSRLGLVKTFSSEGIRGFLS